MLYCIIHIILYYIILYYIILYYIILYYIILYYIILYYIILYYIILYYIILYYIIDCWSVSEYDFSKEEVVEISLHIYVPKGTKMDVRKSTWLNPIIDGHEAMMLTLPEQTKGKRSFEKAFNIVRESNSERNAEIEGAAESNEGDTASIATTSTSVVKKND